MNKKKIIMKDIENLIKSNIKKTLDIVKEVEDEYKLETFKIILPFLLEHEDLGKKREIGKGEEHISLPELIAKINPSTYADTAIIVSFYLFTYDEIIGFNIDNIKNGFNQARAIKPKNMTDTLNGLIKRGFLRSSTDIDGKKGFELTKMGIDYTQNLIKENE